MKQYEFSLTSNYQGQFKTKPMVLNSAYYFLLKDVVGLPSSKFDSAEHEERDI
jgi:hypothetical protein